MYTCPNCHVPLVRAKAKVGIFWACPSCGGRSATIALLRRNIAREVVNALWQRAGQPDVYRKRACPACDAPMAEVPLRLGGTSEAIDVCRRCQFVWFDAREYAALPELPAEKSFMESLPQEARERFAMLELQAIQEQSDRDEAGVDENWKYLIAFFGLPVECQSTRSDTVPWVTWALAAFMVVFGVTSLFDLNSAIQSFGLIPAEAFRYGGLTVLTSFFLHGGLLHLASNVYFLLTFGDNVEYALGCKRYALLIVLSALLGDFIHVLGNAGSMVPCIGASGGISGVITYYALAYPHAKLGLMLRAGLVIKWVNCSARAMLLLWLLLQAFNLWMQVEGRGHVSAMAHLGGVAAGVLFWAMERREGEARG